jgi:hypothetical protein
MNDLAHAQAHAQAQAQENNARYLQAALEWLRELLRKEARQHTQPVSAAPPATSLLTTSPPAAMPMMTPSGRFRWFSGTVQLFRLRLWRYQIT